MGEGECLPQGSRAGMRPHRHRPQSAGLSSVRGMSIPLSDATLALLDPPHAVTAGLPVHWLGRSGGWPGPCPCSSQPAARNIDGTDVVHGA